MAKRFKVMELREIIRRLRNKNSIRSIHRETNISRQKIREILKVSNEKGWLTNKLLPSEDELNKVFMSSPTKPHILDCFKEKIKSWVKSKYTYVVITKLVNQEEWLCSESTVRRYIKKNFSKEPKVTIRRNFPIGETAEVDYGYLGLMYDVESGKNRKVWLFSMRLNYSRKCYREVVFNQKTENFLKAHVNAFEYFNGVPKKVVCDNLKSAVIEASLQEPTINRAYRMLAEHYNFVINPTKPYTPNHKGGVEKDMDYVKRNFLPVFKEDQKIKGRKIPYYTDCQKDLKMCTSKVDDNHIIKYIGESPNNLFAKEKLELLYLPAVRWDPITWYTPKVREDWSVEINKAFYSVPYKYIGCRVSAYKNSREVVIYNEFNQIARHKIAQKTWEKLIVPEHGPVNYQKYLETTSSGIKQWAEQLGESVYIMVIKIFDKSGVDGLRPARAICSLAKKHGTSRLNAACKRALYYNLIKFKSVKKILENGLEELPLEDEIYDKQFKLNFEIDYRFARSGEYYNLN